jgi:hypothetical protein
VETQWDIIVIGSGLGVCRRRPTWRPAVATCWCWSSTTSPAATRTSSGARSYEFDVGVHYIGECGPGGVIPMVLRGVGLEGRVRFLPMDPDGFDTIAMQGLTVRVPHGWDRYRARLVEALPDLFNDCRLSTRACALLAATSANYAAAPSRVPPSCTPA